MNYITHFGQQVFLWFGFLFPHGYEHRVLFFFFRNTLETFFSGTLDFWSQWESVSTNLFMDVHMYKSSIH